MDAVEKAIRTALEKGDAQDRAFREKVYRSAFSALERSLKAQPELTVEAAIKRRNHLKSKITEIESEFIPAVAPATPRPAAPSQPLQATPAAAPASGSAPPVSVERASADNSESDFLPELDRDEADIYLRQDRAETNGDEERRAAARAPTRNRFLRSVLPILLLLGAIVLVGLGLWWALMGGFGSPGGLSEPGSAGRTTEQGQSNQTVTPEGNWINVFTPSDPTTVQAPSGAQAEVKQGDEDSFIQIRSSGPDSGIVFNVGQGVLEQIAGRHAVFNVVARGADGKGTEISISCDFGALGNCGRTRYVVGFERSDYLFEVDMPDQQPGSGGTITIVPDMAGQGRALDIFSIRVSTAD